MKKIVVGAANLSMSETESAFALLGIPPSFKLDLEVLERAYVNAQQRVHPDRCRGALAQRAALRLSSDITQAYHSLKNPLTRAETLLDVQGKWPLPSMEACAGEELLEDMMELQEALREGEIQHLEELVQQAEQALEVIFEGVFEPQMAAQAYHRLAYLQKMRERFHERS